MMTNTRGSGLVTLLLGLTFCQYLLTTAHQLIHLTQIKLFADIEILMITGSNVNAEHISRSIMFISDCCSSTEASLCPPVWLNPSDAPDVLFAGPQPALWCAAELCGDRCQYRPRQQPGN